MLTSTAYGRRARGSSRRPPSDARAPRFDCHVAEIVEAEGIRGDVRPYALNPERAKPLWAKSEAMVGERF